MNMMKRAGYKNLLDHQPADNHRPQYHADGIFARPTADTALNRRRCQSAREYDTNVLKPFQDVLNDPAPKKPIIVHLLGTHIKYKYRLPGKSGQV
ncbi:sulfatase-like hydrolase/transferase [Escherichia coli]